MSQVSLRRALSRFDRLSRRQRIILTLLAMLLVLVVASTATLVAIWPDSAPSGTPSTSAPAAPAQPLTLSALPAPPPLNAPAGQWVNGGPAFAQDVTFAPSAPSTLFACGSAGRGGKLALGISHDGGKTWTAQATSVTGQDCALSVSPSDRNHVALAVEQCQGVCATNVAALYLSHDGGVRWQQAQVAGSGFGMVMAWAGTTLFAATNTPQHPLAVSVAGGAFALRDDLARFPGQIVAFGAVGATMYAALQTTSTAPPVIVQSDDDGAVWRETHFNDGPFPVTYAGTSADGKMLIGLENGDTLVLSSDGGQTWQAQTPFPQGLTLATPPFVARSPNGALVALLHTAQVSDPTLTLALLPPGAGAWQTLAAPPANVQLSALDWDAQGQPRSLWGATTDVSAAQQEWLYQI